MKREKKNMLVWVEAEMVDGAEEAPERQISEPEPSEQIGGLNTVCWLNADWLMSSRAVNPGVIEFLTPPGSVSSIIITSTGAASDMRPNSSDVLLQDEWF